MSAADTTSRQSSLNNGGSGGMRLNMAAASHSQDTSGVADSAKGAFVNINSSRAVVNSNGVSVQRSSISLK